MERESQIEGTAGTPRVRVQLDREAVRAHAGTAALVLVLLVGAWFRLSGANWDDAAHLHPDERYIASLANNLRFPTSPLTYLDVGDSPLSPYNTEGGESYSYGTLPLFGTKAVADAVGQGDYDHLYLTGRRLSALLDLATTLLVFLLARALLADAGPRRALQAGLLAAALYALTVAAIQASHFFTTDVWQVFFGTLAFYLGVLALRSPAWTRARGLAVVAGLGACLGFSVASKASGLFVAIPVVIAVLGKTAIDVRRGTRHDVVLRLARDGLLLLVAGYVSFRLVSPYSFASSNWLDVRLGSAYRAALQQQRDILDGKAIFPPTMQWLVSPRLTDPFKNLVVWQLGVPLALSAIVGLGALAVDAVRRRANVAALALRIMVLAYVAIVFLYVATRFQHMGRYLLPIVPLLAVAASYGMFRIFGSRPRLLAVVAGVVVALTGAYALAFHAIYTKQTTRLAASEWLANHTPLGTKIANEHWDDTIPVGRFVLGRELVIVPVFEPDDETKLRKLYEPLAVSDYYSLSSPRAWRTIGRLPDRYPLMVRFYRQLFAGRLGFEEVKSFKSQPNLLGVTLDDLGAEEAFWVYDHPPVRVFRHRERLTFAEFRDALCAPPAPSACG